MIKFKNNPLILFSLFSVLTLTGCIETISVIIGVFVLIFILWKIITKIITNINVIIELFFLLLPVIILIIAVSMYTVQYENHISIHEDWMQSRIRCNKFEYFYNKNLQATCWKIVSNRLHKLQFENEFVTYKECIEYFSECDKK